MNEAYLVSLSIGPVQDFIAAALRTSDLWFGSNMLSEVSKAAALAMRERGAELIFPAVADGSDLILEPSFNVANRIVAQIDGDDALVKMFVKDSKAAARDRLSQMIEQAKEEYQRKIKGANLREDVWVQQAKPGDLLELYATWVTIAGDDYPQARKRLDRLTAARKNSREFIQPEINPEGKGYGLPKSSLDGRRETVLPVFPEKNNRNYRRILRMGDGEQLDLMGLIKRLAGGKVDQFTPTTRIATDGWIKEIADTDQGTESLKAIGLELEKLRDSGQSGLVTRVSGNQGIYADMPFDGALLYRDRLDTALRDCRTGKLDNKYQEDLRHLRSILEPLWKIYGQPGPYYVLMLADGDHMGTLLDKAETMEGHQKISGLLAEFAQAVPRRVRDKRGHCIYAGGDDVLAMVPLDKAIDLADDLRQFFSEKLKGIAQHLGVKEPTFSVGMVLAHMQAPLSQVRRLAARAEKLAKGNETESPRNALGIIVVPRSGADLNLRIRWDADNPAYPAPLERIKRLMTFYKDGKLPTRFGYELRELANLLAGMDTAVAGKIKEQELIRILNRKNQSGGDKQVSEETRNTVLKYAKKVPFADVFNEHLIARWLGVH